MALFARRSDLPLDKDPLSRFLPWLIAFMVFLAAMALMGMLVFEKVAGKWDTNLTNTLTIQVPPAETKLENKRRSQKVIEVLLKADGVLTANVIGDARIAALLAPWLGPSISRDLPLPYMIDVELTDDSTLDVDALATRLSIIAPGTQVDDHRVWLGHMIRLVRSVEALAAAVLAFILTATVGTVVFATRTGLTIHQEAIEVLHMTGAHDRYIAAQFAGRALLLGLKGGLLGLGLAVPTLWGLGQLAGELEGGMLPAVTLGKVAWGSLLSLPVLVSVIAMLTARFTVLRNLRRML